MGFVLGIYRRLRIKTFWQNKESQATADAKPPEEATDAPKVAEDMQSSQRAGIDNW